MYIWFARLCCGVIGLVVLGSACASGQEIHSTQPGSASATTAFVEVQVLPMTGEAQLLPRQTVLVREGTIAAIGPVDSIDIPRDAVVIDGAGRYLMPGLADMHVHTFDRDEFLLNLANGITAVRNLHGIDRHLRWRDSLAAHLLLGPRLFTSGPILDGDPPDRPTNTVLRTAAEAVAEVRRQKQAGYDFIKLYDNVPRDLYEVIARTAQAEGIPVVGHVPTPVGLAGLLEVGGQLAVEHVEELAPFFDDGRDTTGLQSAARSLAEAGVWLGPTIATWMWPMRQTDPAVIADPNRRYLNPRTMRNWRWATEPATMGARGQRIIADRRAFALAFTRAFHEAGGRLLAGSDAPIPTMIPGFSLIEELRVFVELGLTPYEALETVTRNPAAFVGQEGAWGVVAVGGAADLVLLEANPLEAIDHLQRQAGVMVRGRWLPAAYLQAELQALASKYASQP